VDKARVLDAADLKIRLQASFERQIGVDDLAAFAALSGDYNPLHIDPQYAQATKYESVIVHGAFQVALASAMAGMYLPGRNVVVGSYNSRFPAPLFAPTTVRVQGEIMDWLASANTGVLRVTVVELKHSTLTADILVSFSLLEQTLNSRVVENPTERIERLGRPLLVVTGAGGDLGMVLVSALADSYRIKALCHTHVSPALSSLAGVGIFECDLEAVGWEAALDGAIAGEPVYGVLHCAWPGAPKGSLLEADIATVARQVEFGSLATIRLVRWLAQRAHREARFVAISTSAASLRPQANMAAYSLGKATLEHTIRLLAPELARKGITINAILPSFMALGMNKTATSRATLAETAKVPAGRLCTPDDIVAALRYLLSKEAAFVSGQLFPLTGGQL